MDFFLNDAASLHVKTKKSLASSDDRDYSFAFSKMVCGCTARCAANTFNRHVRRLAAQTQSLDESTVALDVLFLQIGEQLTALTNEHRQRACCVVILVVLLQVLGEVRNAIAEQSHLAFYRTCVGSAMTILLEDLYLFFFVKIHS